MVRIEPDSARTHAASWDCPRCGRTNRDRDRSCPNCRLVRRGGPSDRAEPARKTPAHPAFHRPTTPAPADRPDPTPRRDDLLRADPAPARDAEALAALAAVLTHYERWQALTRGPHHRFQLGAVYLTRVPADTPLLEAFRFEAASLVLDRLRAGGLIAVCVGCALGELRAGDIGEKQVNVARPCADS